MVYVSSNASFFNFCVWIILVDKWMMCALNYIAVDVFIFIDFSIYKRHKSIIDDIFILSFHIPLIQKNNNRMHASGKWYCYGHENALLLLWIEVLVSRVKGADALWCNLIDMPNEISENAYPITLIKSGEFSIATAMAQCRTLIVRWYCCYWTQCYAAPVVHFLDKSILFGLFAIVVAPSNWTGKLDSELFHYSFTIFTLICEYKFINKCYPCRFGYTTIWHGSTCADAR